MIVLDTNILSPMMQDQADPIVKAWLATQSSDQIWTTAISIFEVQYGLSILASGKKQRTLQDAFDRAIKQDFSGRVLTFDTGAAVNTAIIAAKLRSIGRSIDMRDAMIVGTVASRQATLATRNTKHSADTGIALINPFAPAAPSP